MVGLVGGLEAQLSLESCQEKARANYPMIRQFDLIEQAKSYQLANAGKGFLPQLSLSARATYQSEVIEIPVSIPNFPIAPLEKDQYQVVAELSQVIWDGGLIRSQREMTTAGSAIEARQLEVELYQLREQVNQVFFGILLLEEQQKQLALLDKELQTQYARVEAYIDNGLANATDLEVIRAEMLNTQQRSTELKGNRQGFLQMLSALLGETLAEDIVLEKPVAADGDYSLASARPELRLLEARKGLALARESLLSAKNLPKLGLFFQGGYGRPGLNMLENEFSPFYMGGIRLAWNLGGLYTQRNERQLLKLEDESTELQKERFLFSTQLEISRQQAEINKLRELLQRDQEIIRLRSNIQKAAQSKLDNGIITVNELVREILAADLSRQVRALHEIQLIAALEQLRWITNH